jgi:hypothetical protein
MDGVVISPVSDQSVAQLGGRNAARLSGRSALKERADARQKPSGRVVTGSGGKSRWVGTQGDVAYDDRATGGERTEDCGEGYRAAIEALVVSLGMTKRKTTTPETVDSGGTLSGHWLAIVEALVVVRPTVIWQLP